MEKSGISLGGAKVAQPNKPAQIPIVLSELEGVTDELLGAVDSLNSRLVSVSRNEPRETSSDTKGSGGACEVSDRIGGSVSRLTSILHNIRNLTSDLET
jgi:hypothetical protein